MRPPTAAELELHEIARAAIGNAHAPYSAFPVAAAVRTEGGAVVVGVNVENASYGLTSCAERNAVFAAVSAGHRRLTAVAVHAPVETAPPCGACRQVLHEFGPEMTVVFPHEGELVAVPLHDLLPVAFRL